MIIKSLEVANFRNYTSLYIPFSAGVNILYGDNAQGKTNILEAIFLSATTKSHKAAKDQEMIQFGESEAHIRTILEKDNVPVRVDMHLRAGKSKGIAVDLQKIKKASQLMGLLSVVFFSPEDLNIIKNSPAERRRFADMELCQTDGLYLHDLNHYNRTVSQRNQVLKDLYFHPELRDTLDIWDRQLVEYGSRIIEKRQRFTNELAPILEEIHAKLSGSKERLKIVYQPNVTREDFKRMLAANREKDEKWKQTTAGPHRDDFLFMTDDVDIRRFGSQGQQRTAALSLKLAEIELIRNVIHDNPVLLLDDVLSELDSNRQNYLLDTLGGIQTIITCTGLDEFVNHRFAIDQVYKIEAGHIVETERNG